MLTGWLHCQQWIHRGMQSGPCQGHCRFRWLTQTQVQDHTATQMLLSYTLNPAGLRKWQRFVDEANRCRPLSSSSRLSVERDICPRSPGGSLLSPGSQGSGTLTHSAHCPRSPPAYPRLSVLAWEPHGLWLCGHQEMQSVLPYGPMSKHVEFLAGGRRGDLHLSQL